MSEDTKEESTQPEEQTPVKEGPVIIGIVCGQHISNKFFASFLNCKKEPNQQILINDSTSSDIARAQILESAVKSNASGVILIDSNVVVPKDLVQKLLSHNKDVVSALSFDTKYPYYPLLFKHTEKNEVKLIDNYEKGLIKVDDIGFSAIYLSRTVINKIDFSKNIVRNAVAKGFEIYVDTELVAPAIGTSVITEELWLEVRKQALQKKLGGKGKSDTTTPTTPTK